MASKSQLFAAPTDQALQKLAAWSGSTVSQPSEEVRHLFLDTLDWRLWRHGLVLEAFPGPHGQDLILRDRDSGRVRLRQRVAKLPHGSDAIHSSKWRNRLHQLIQRRVLQPMVSATSRICILPLRDPKGRSAGQLEIRHEQLLAPHRSEPVNLPPHAALIPAEGRKAVPKKLRSVLIRKGRLSPLGRDPLSAAMAELGTAPSYYDERPHFEIEARQPALVALREILGVYRRLMENNITGACEGEDPDHLRDFMIASRRTQCLLNRLPVFPEQTTRLLKQDLHWIEEIAAPIRDLDIYLTLFDEFAAEVRSGDQPVLRPLHDFHIEQKRDNMRRMCIALHSPRFKRMLATWERMLRVPQPAEALPSAANRPVAELAAQSIRQLVAELLKGGRHGLEHSEPEATCELLRIGKRLGYQLEIFGPLFRKKRLRRLMQAHRDLQDALNRFRLLHLQQRALDQYKTNIKQEYRVSPISIEALHQLIVDRTLAREKARRRCARRFADFATAVRAKPLDRLLAW